MSQLNQSWWNAITISGSPVSSLESLSNEELRLLVRTIRQFAETNALQPLMGKAIEYLVTALDHLQTLPRDKIDACYISFVEQLINQISHQVARSPNPDTESDKPILNLLERIAIFQELYKQTLTPKPIRYGKGKLLGHYLREMNLVTTDQLLDALDAQRAGLYPESRIGDILIVRGIITRAQLDEAIERQMIDGLEGEG